MIFPMSHGFILWNENKKSIYTIFGTFNTLVENLFNCKIKKFYSDEGKEFDQTSMHDLFLKYGIYFRKSYPNRQQQNGVTVGDFIVQYIPTSL